MPPSTQPIDDDRNLPVAHADSLSHIFLAGGVLHIYFCSTAPARSGPGMRRVVSAKVALTTSAFLELQGHLTRLALCLEQRGVLRRAAEAPVRRQ